MKKIYMSGFLGVSLLLTACQGGTDDVQGDQNQNPEPSSDDPPANTEESVLNFAFNAQPPNLDPHMTAGGATRDISRNIFETLVTFNSNYEVEPMLADTYEVSDDGETITFNLREGVYFHNGKEMTAEDVIASMERWQETSSQGQSFFSETEYEADGDYTVIAHLTSPGSVDLFTLADFAQFAAIMPSEVIEDASMEGINEYIGTGPFQFEEWQQDHYIRMSKFDDYQSREEPADGLAGSKEAFVDEINFYMVTDPSTRISGMQSQEYHIANHIPHDNVDQLEQSQHVDIEPAMDMFPAMVFNKREGIFTDETMRQALNAAFDYDEMLMAAYGGAEYSTDNHELMPEAQTDWYTDAGREAYETYDPELAEELLEEAGYDGEEVEILTSREFNDYYTISVVAEQQLEAVGVNATLNVVDWATAEDLRNDPDAYDIYLNGWHLRPHPLQYPFLDSENEFAGWTDSEEIDNLLDSIQYAESQEEAAAFTEELQEEFWSYLPLIKPGNTSIITSTHTDLEGFTSFHGPILWNVSLNE